MSSKGCMDKEENRGLRRLVKATGYSIAGLSAAWKNEEAFRIECILTAIMIPAAFWLGETTIEIVLLIGSCLIVIITELLNSAIETIVDRIGTEHHDLSGRAKDIGSAAVFVSLILTATVWVMIAIERFSF